MPVWGAMIQRCTNSKNKDFGRYGGRGITVCERWHIFSNFLEDMGEPSSGMSLDRIDNDKGYSKDNCRWATRYEQAQNSRSNRVFTLQGESMCLAEWARRFGINYYTLISRIDRGWYIGDALKTPTMKGSRTIAWLKRKRVKQ